MPNTYAIADLHGSFDLLTRAIELIEADAEGGTFICLGDFVDRGPKSREIVERLMAGPSSPAWKWIVLQGNHESMMLQTLRDPSRNLHWWMGNGGGATLDSYGYQEGDYVLPWKVPVSHVHWLDNLPVFHEDDHRIYVHAGVQPDVPLAESTRKTLQWMLYRGEKEYKDAEMADDLQHVSGKHIVHGHQQSLQHPLLAPHRTNLDSFAYYGGKLAIGVFDDATPSGPVKVLNAYRAGTMWP
jgi:serine/threonine protein phosphatase 1